MIPMKKTVHFFLAFNLFLSCENPSILETISDKNVTISFRKDSDEKVLVLNVPLEFTLNLNSEKIKNVRIYYISNGKLSSLSEDYAVYDRASNQKLLFDIKKVNQKYPANIYIIDRRISIQEEKALELVNRYAPNSNLSNLQSDNDSITLTSYKKFREDNPQFITNMRKESDSLKLNLVFGKGKTKIIGKKIEW